MAESAGSASLVHLWGLGVGAAISGNLFGWNYGLASGGGAVLVALALSCALFWCLVHCVAHMASLFPCPGGAAMFAHRALGPAGAFAAGVAQSVEYALTPAVVATGVVGYVSGTLGVVDDGGGTSLRPLWWLAVYAAFVAVDLAGVGASLSFGVVVSAASVALVAAYDASAAAHSDWALWGPAWFAPADGGGPALCVARAMPYAVWFFLAVEELPLAAGEAANPARDVPLASLLSVATLSVCAVCTAASFSATPPGARAVAASSGPAATVLLATYGDRPWVRALSMPAVLGLAASMHSVTYACGRQLQAMAEQGFYPRALAASFPGRQGTPGAAVVCGSLVGYCALLAVWYLPGPSHRAQASAVLLNMSVFGALLSYVVQMVAFLALWWQRRNGKLAPRPLGAGEPSALPLGPLPGVVALALSVATIVCLFISDRLNLYALAGVAACYCLCLVLCLVTRWCSQRSSRARENDLSNYASAQPDERQVN
eukprot:m51a1_g13474 hypothetical protein (487) ;mRNA; r:84-1544